MNETSVSLQVLFVLGLSYPCTCPPKSLSTRITSIIISLLCTGGQAKLNSHSPPETEWWEIVCLQISLQTYATRHLYILLVLFCNFLTLRPLYSKYDFISVCFIGLSRVDGSTKPRKHSIVTRPFFSCEMGSSLSLSWWDLCFKIEFYPSKSRDTAK